MRVESLTDCEKRPKIIYPIVKLCELRGLFITKTLVQMVQDKIVHLAGLK